MVISIIDDSFCSPPIVHTLQWLYIVVGLGVFMLMGGGPGGGASGGSGGGGQ